MRFLFCLLGLLSSVVTASPMLDASNDGFVDLLPSSQKVNSDTIDFNPLNLNDASENIFSNAGTDNSYDFLSSDPITYSDGLSSEVPNLEAQPDLFENAGAIAFSDSSLLNVPINQDSPNDASLDGNLVSSLVTVQGRPPACSSLDRGSSKVEFKSLCCQSPCIDDQSWRKTCDYCIQLLGLRLILYLLNELRGFDMSIRSSCLLSNIQCKL